MTLRDDLLPMVDDLQAIAGPACFGVRTNALFVVSRQWTVSDDLGTYVDHETEILPRPRIKERNRGRELIVEPVQQKYVDIAVGGVDVSGGFDADMLNAADAAKMVVFFRVAGPNAGHYSLVDYSASRAFRQRLILKRLPGDTGKRLAMPQPQGTSDSAF